MDLHSRDCPIDIDALYSALGVTDAADRDLFRLAFDCGHVYARRREAGGEPPAEEVARTVRMWRAARSRAAGDPDLMAKYTGRWRRARSRLEAGR